MSADDLPWDDLRLFLALMREGSLAGGGRVLGVETSTVSRRLAATEKRLGVRLFDRTREGLVATDAAKVLRDGAEQAEAGVLRFRRDLAGMDETVAGEVRISAPPGVVESFLVDAAVRLRERHPELWLSLLPSTALADLHRREADLALRAKRPEAQGLVMKKVLEFRHAPLAAPALAERLGPVVDWVALPWVVPGPGILPPPVAAAWAKTFAAAKPVLVAGDVVALLRAVESGVGVGLLPEIYAPHRGLVALEAAPRAAEAPVGPSSEVFLMGHAALRNVPRIAAVWSFIEEEMESLF